MKKSDLKKYIKENILSSLSENTEDEISQTKDLTAAVQDLKKAKDEAGIEEANIGLADLEEMGYEAGEKSFDMHFDKSILKNRPDTKSYAKGFVQAIIDSAGSLRLDESFNSLAKKLDKQKGIDKEEAGKIAGSIAAKKMKGAGKGPTAKQIKRVNENEGRTKMPTQDQVNKFFSLTQNEIHYLNSKPVAGQEKTFNDTEVEPWDEYDLSNWNSLVKKAKTKGKSIDENEDNDTDKDTEKDAVKLAKSARGKHKKLDIAVKALKDITTEMKSIAREYSKADGVEKEKIKDQLKTKTAKKKELESLVAKLEKNVV